MDGADYARGADRQYTPVRDTLARYGSLGAYNEAVYGSLGSHPDIIWGWSTNGQLYRYWMSAAGMEWALQPICFTGDARYFGWFRFVNTKSVHDYLGGKAYDPVYYAPKDHVTQRAVAPCLADPGEWSIVDGCDKLPIWSSYCLSPAALFDPNVFRPDDPGLPDDARGWQDPWTLPSGFRVPDMSRCRYPDLKTHLLEHHWLQNTEVVCNHAFDAVTTVLVCEPYHFNHGLTSQPVAVFYDLHVSLVGVHEAMLADRRHERQFGWGLWSRDTTFGDDGHLIGHGYDFAATSFHILTTEGIHGRDLLGRE